MRCHSRQATGLASSDGPGSRGSQDGRRSRGNHRRRGPAAGRPAWRSATRRIRTVASPRSPPLVARHAPRKARNVVRSTLAGSVYGAKMR